MDPCDISVEWSKEPDHLNVKVLGKSVWFMYDLYSALSRRDMRLKPTVLLLQYKQTTSFYVIMLNIGSIDVSSS